MEANQTREQGHPLPPSSTDKPMLPVLDTPTRLKLARGILDEACNSTGAGYLLVMFVPGSDLVMRSFKGLDTPEECVAMAKEVSAMLQAHVQKLNSKGPKELHNG